MTPSVVFLNAHHMPTVFIAFDCNSSSTTSPSRIFSCVSLGSLLKALLILNYRPQSFYFLVLLLLLSLISVFLSRSTGKEFALKIIDKARCRGKVWLFYPPLLLPVHCIPSSCSHTFLLREAHVRNTRHYPCHALLTGSSVFCLFLTKSGLQVSSHA